ncbi:death-associated inhibitor of apoptosis 2-like isoform X2 [Adelges cooleyi]|uniref:death-associated inhibitor of apoptosis 2-like isoform X2 n=1 Tax=Adelges cooleyi TaxID=133065 RepID=UPI00217F720E|nr:death-associated inhibitor of apoptosis 2-like isoform X2 [Adelges cooleyi]
MYIAFSLLKHSCCKLTISRYYCLETTRIIYNLHNTHELLMSPSPNHNSLAHTLRNIVKHEKNVIHMANGCPIILNTAHPLTEFVSDSQPESTPMSANETPLWDLTTFENRLRTFNDEWKLEFLTPNQMAKAGLYYLGKQDRVRCMFCSKEFDYWQRGDDPLVEHKRKSPQCPFFKENTGYDVCGLYGSPPSDKSSNEEAKKIQNFLDSLGVVQQIKTPKHKEYATYDARLATFDKCEKKMKQETHTLCEAGFFYIGDGQNDQMLCFCCSQGLKDWEDDDEPWTEHARWSPNCSYVLLSKGKNFVDEACGKKKEIPTIDKEELTKFIANHKDNSILESNIKVSSTKRKRVDHPETTDSNQMTASLSEINLRLSQQDPNTMPDSMLCKICFKEKMKVAFIPCGHVIACIQCAMTLDQCAVCRQPFTMAMRVYVYMDENKNEEKDEDLNQLPCSSSQCSDDPVDPMLCRVCHKEEMEAAFIPCRHVYACVECATKMSECPVCLLPFYATMQVYL